jgi:hypothetical protein
LASTGYASGVKHPLDARIHLFLFDEFLPVGLRDAFRTAARKRASFSSGRKAASFTSRSVSVPA